MSKNKIKTIEKNINELETGDIFKAPNGSLRIIIEKLTTLIHKHTTGYIILDLTTRETYKSRIEDFDKTKKTRGTNAQNTKEQQNATKERKKERR